MEITEYLRIIRRRWVSILLSVLIVGALAVGITLAQTKTYESEARLFVSTSQGDTTSEAIAGGTYSAARVASYADLVTSQELATKVIEELKLNASPAEIAGKVEAVTVKDTVNLNLVVADSDPQRAQSLAQTYATQLVDLVRELETPPGSQTPTIKATIIDNASASNTPVSPSWPRNIGLGLVLGLLIGIGVAILRETVDTRITAVEDLRERADAPILGGIPFDPIVKDQPLITSIPSHSRRAEAFRVLRTNLQFVDVDTPRKVFVVSSAVPDEGKTTTAVNLALSLAQTGARALLIEGDLRRPRAASRLEMDSAIGVTNVLVGRVKLADALQTHHDTGLDFLAAGPIPPNPAELLQSRAMAELVAAARELYDIVIIDAPPLLPVTDAALIASHADGAILVVRHGKVTRDQVDLSVERLEAVEARLVGVVFNMVPGKGKGYGYGYSYGYAPDSRHVRT